MTRSDFMIILDQMSSLDNEDKGQKIFFIYLISFSIFKKKSAPVREILSIPKNHK